LLAFIARRVASTIPVLGVVAVVVFLVLRLGPGDPAAVLAGDFASPAQIAAIREDLGLNEPLYVQFADWLQRLAQGDMGKSFFFQRPVTELIVQRLEPTLALATTTIILAVLVAVPLGVIAAHNQDSWLDRAVMLFSVAGFSVPVFVTGYVLIYLFAIQLRLVPVQGYTPLADGFWPFLQRLVLPSITLSVIYIALIARITRASVFEVLTEDYIRTARAKGLSERRVLFRHALRNAAELFSRHVPVDVRRAPKARGERAVEARPGALRDMQEDQHRTRVSWRPGSANRGR
jgi:peptide/nickel transport system permease protein